MNVPEGDPLHIPCGVSFAGRDGPATGEKVHWSHNGAPLGTTEDGQVRKGPDGALSVERTSLALAGNYTCTVKNTAGNATSTVMVQVGGELTMGGGGGGNTRGREEVSKNV